MRKLLLLAATLCVAATTPVLARDWNRDDRICIRQDDVRNWTALSDKKIVIESYRHKRALLRLIGTCSGFRFTDALEIRSPGASRLSCVSVGDTIVTHQGIGGRCAVVSVTPYAGSMNHHDRDHDNDSDDDHAGDHDDHGDHDGDHHDGDHGRY